MDQPKESASNSAIGSLTLSTSVLKVENTFGSDEKVNAWDIVKRLFALHPEYAGGKGMELVKLSLLPYGFTREPVSFSEWIKAIGTIIDEDYVEFLDGRLIILGLCLFEEGLEQFLLERGIIGALLPELGKPFYSLLTIRARLRFAGKSWAGIPDQPGQQQIDHTEALGKSTTVMDQEPPAPIESRSDSVSFHLDLITAEDLLNRRPFAKALASRVRQLLPLEGPFVVNVHGRWGAGKTKLLRMLKEELEANSGASGIDSSWVVVDFNAWQQQRIGSPWWAMMMAVFSQSRQALWHGEKIKWAGLWIRHLWWRAGLTRWAISFLILAVAVIVGASYEIFSSLLRLLITHTTELTERIDVLTGGLAVVAVLYTVGQGIWRWLRLGTAKGTCNLLESGHDPLEPLASHFSSTVRHIHRPVAVFVDDLDRCQADYVVSLLEGIHTIFRDAGVLYVIAGDRRWICASYEKGYQDFTNSVTEPGRPLGHFFLEKIFQLSLSVPRMPARIQENYLRHLLNVVPEMAEAKGAEYRREMEARFDTLSTEDSILEEVKKFRDTEAEPFAQAAGVVRLAVQEVKQHTEHVLLKYAPFMEYNPRWIKRFLNAYSTNRAVATLNGVDLTTNQLALWTILELRWPMLGEHFCAYPEHVEFLGKSKATWEKDVPLELHKAFEADDVQYVLLSAGTPKLDGKTILDCASLRS